MDIIFTNTGSYLNFTIIVILTVKIGMDVKIPISNDISAYLAVIKAREAPLDLKSSLPNQLQVITMTVNADDEASTSEINQSFFTRLHQFTRHYYAPLARSARNNTQVL